MPNNIEKKHLQNQSNSGVRLKKARIMAGFTRQALEDKYGISVNTLQAWENEKSPLTLKGAAKMLEVLDDSGIACSIDWLLYGIGTLPQLKDTRADSFFPFNRTEVKPQEINWSDEAAIIHEIEAFRTFNQNSLVIIVPDDSMLPAYTVGDYVGGKRKTIEQFEQLLGTNCIVETKDGFTILRHVAAIKTQGILTLSTINPYTTISTPVLYDVEVINLSPIIWHRKSDAYQAHSTPCIRHPDDKHKKKR